MPTPIAVFKSSRTVRWVDVDASGLAHFSSYVRMMEETEYAFLRSRGLSVVLPDARGTLGFPRLSSSVKILRPLEFGQSVEVQLGLIEMDGKQIVYQFRIVLSNPEGKGHGEVAVEGQFVVAACRFPAGRPLFAVLIPDEVESALRGVEVDK